MKLLFLSKRRPMGRDLFERPYGRFYYLPRQCAERGHDVTLLLLEYGNAVPFDEQRDGLRWLSEPLLSRSPVRYLRRLCRVLETDRPDWIIGLSDTYFGILAQYYGRKFGIRSCIDAYDNYESYIQWLKPLHSLWRHALSHADLVTAAGPDLLRYMNRQRNARPAAVVPMAADPIGFRLLDQAECRSRMGLPEKGKFIGYCGSTHKNRGVHVLFEAFELLRKRRPEVSLLMSGRSWSNVKIPDSAYQLGYIDDAEMPVLLNCMDVLTVLNRPTSFGTFSHPVKLYEAMSCGVPVIASATPATRWILRDNPDCLVPPSDPEALCGKLERFLEMGRVTYSDVTDWQTNAGVFEQMLLQQIRDS
ncbi:MAG TPA: glycosyltransferase family 4 protein [Gammaproteobacteria bacterium]|nr:glycosyltransferase family 4 protein [Gammaproteobacteria bacterium]